MLITFANSLDLYQARQNFGYKLSDILNVFRKEVFEIVNLERKNQQTTKKNHAKFPSMQRIEHFLSGQSNCLKCSTMMRSWKYNFYTVKPV